MSNEPLTNGKTPTLLERRLESTRLSAVQTRISLSNPSRSSPVEPSPLSSSFSHPHLHISTPSPTSFAFPSSPSSPQLSTNGLTHAPPGRRHRAHHRIHSRNLSVFFPRPDALQQPTTIHEDGSEDIHDAELTPPPTIMPSTDGSSPNAPNPSGQLTTGFKFGARPPDSAPSDPPTHPTIPIGPAPRRGHHHKHSLSHNFFSFLEPGAQHAPDLHTQPTPVPVSPWNPISPFPRSAASTKTAFSPIENPDTTPDSPVRHKPADDGPTPPEPLSPLAVACALSQFVLGAWLWVRGQHITSLSCMGLGYWVVFDSMGVALVSILPQWLASSQEHASRRFYGIGRVVTVWMFAQAVYLMFAAVYVTKEALEHVLLHAGSARTGEHVGSAAAHAAVTSHHHHSPESGIVGLDVPVYLVLMALLSIVGTAFMYDNHSVLADVADNRLPSLSAFLDSLIAAPRRYAHLSDHHTLLGSQTADVLSNPYVVAPIGFCVAILFNRFFVTHSYHRVFDAGLAAVEAVLTFRMAYRACVVLGGVLLQTSPPRGHSNGRMEAFLRVMKEIERHPQVVHLPPPHIWQVTPMESGRWRSARRRKGRAGKRDSPVLVVTLELHVRSELEDEEVVGLTRWTWEKCVTALGGDPRERGGTGEVDVTVGVVRG